MQLTSTSLSMAGNHLVAATAAPWRISNELRRYLSLPYIRMAFAWNGIQWNRGWRVLGMPHIQRHRNSKISIGQRVILRSWRASNPLIPHHPVVFATRSAYAVIQIGEDCGFTGTTIVAATGVFIGNRVQVGANCTIVDTDFHPLTAEDRSIDFLNGASDSVIIEDDVFIGMNSLILKGVTIGHDSVIGAGSVVTKDVPSGVVVAGNPARVVKELEI